MNTAATVNDKGCTRNTSGWLNNWRLIPETQFLRGGRADLGAGGSSYGNVVSFANTECGVAEAPLAGAVELQIQQVPRKPTRRINA